MNNKTFSWRIFISLGLTTSFLMLLASGIVLFIAPPGRVANWTGWQILGLSKSSWQDQHTLFGLAFAVLSVFHLFVINWKAFFGYLKSKASKGLSHPVELSLILALTLLFGVGTALHLQPFSSVTALGEKLKGGWEAGTTEPPVPHAETMTLEELALQPSVGRSAPEILEALRAAGLEAASTTETLGDIARRSGITASEAYRLVMPEGKRVEKVEKAGFGRKTLRAVAEEHGVSPESLRLALGMRGIQATEGETMRQVAESNGIGVPDLRSTVEEILR